MQERKLGHYTINFRFYPHPPQFLKFLFLPANSAIQSPAKEPLSQSTVESTSSSDPDPNTESGPTRHKHLSPIGRHAISKFWDDGLPQDILKILNANGVEWTSLNPCRAGYADDDDPPVTLWITYKPGSLDDDKRRVVIEECKKLLEGLDLDDVVVDLQEGVVKLY